MDKNKDTKKIAGLMSEVIAIAIKAEWSTLEILGLFEDAKIRFWQNFIDSKPKNKDAIQAIFKETENGQD